jgi:four helix bundle protein
MARIERFEDIEAWKLAREATRRIYLLSSDGEFYRDYGLKDQIRRSSVSTMGNIAEGFEREGNREFVNFLGIAKGSCAETRSHLYVALDQNYIDEIQFREAYDCLEEAGRKIGGFMSFLKQSDFKGSKFA